MDYSGRRISGVLAHFERALTPDGMQVFSGNITITISNSAGEDNGPHATITIAVPTENPDPTMKEAEKELLAGALGVLSRIAASNPDELQGILEQDMQNAILKPEV